MEKDFLNNEPERFAMKQFCDLLRNTADRCIAISLYCSIAISQYHNIVGAWNMTIFC